VRLGDEPRDAGVNCAAAADGLPPRVAQPAAQIEDRPHVLVRKGGLHYIERITPAGQAIRIFDEQGNHITDAMRDYVRPLVRGEAPIRMGEDGLPAFMRFERKPLEKKLPKYM
jgi:hypothetical protein